MRILGIVVAAVWLWLGDRVAQAAACDTPATPLIQAICADGSARNAYAELERDVAEAIARLSPQGQTILKASQTRWRQRFAAACIGHLDASAHRNEWLDHQMQQCLESFLSARKSFLREQGQRAAGFILQPIDDDQDVYCEAGDSTNVISISRRTVRIDAPESAAINRWNKAQAEGVTGIVDISDDACERDGDSDESLTVDFADGDLVQVKSSYYQYFSDMPHAQWAESSRLELIEGGRAIGASDVFDDKTDWRNYVANRLFAEYLATVKTNHATAKQTLGDFRQIAEQTSFWSINGKALTYGFGPYDLDGYANANFEVAFTWKELRPYLRADLPLQPDFN